MKSTCLAFSAGMLALAFLAGCDAPASASDGGAPFPDDPALTRARHGASAPGDVAAVLASDVRRSDGADGPPDLIDGMGIRPTGSGPNGISP